MESFLALPATALSLSLREHARGGGDAEPAHLGVLLLIWLTGWLMPVVWDCVDAS
jgi:hypothetical protein